MSALPLVLVGGVATGLYFLLKPKSDGVAPTGPGRTVAAEAPTVVLTAQPSTAQEIKKRIDEIRTLYRMGRLDRLEAVKQAQALLPLADKLRSEGRTSTVEYVALMAELTGLTKDLA